MSLLTTSQDGLNVGTGIQEQINAAATGGSLTSSIWEYLKGLSEGGTFGNILSAGGGLALAENYARDVEKAGLDASTAANTLGTSLASGSQFKPFTVTTGLSTATTDSKGGYDLVLNPTQKVYQDDLFKTAAGLLKSATEDSGTREQQIFDRLQAMTSPGQERERLELENRLFNQGRGGVSTAAYGGTPEQLARAKAIEEQRSTDVFGAMQQSLIEQEQNARIGSGLFEMGYLPQQQAIASMTPAINLADIAGAGQRAGIQAQGLLGQTGIEARFGGANTAAGTRSNALAALISSLSTPKTNAAGNTTQQSIIDRALGGLFSKFIKR